jgi:quinol monooxygenase YgiN
MIFKGLIMIIMTVLVKVKPDKREEFLQAIRSLHGEEDDEKGFNKSTLFQEMDDPAGFRLIQEWEIQSELETYLSEEKFRVLLGALKILCEKSEIRYSRKAESPALTNVILLQAESQ